MSITAQTSRQVSPIVTSARRGSFHDQCQSFISHGVISEQLCQCHVDLTACFMALH